MPDTPAPAPLPPLAPTVWPTLTCADARAEIDFLVAAFGFVETAAHSADDDTPTIVHAELRWPEGGGVMLGDRRDDPTSPFASLPTGVTSSYVVTDRPDEVHDRAVAAGAEIVRGLRDEDYGSRGFTARDPEGNLWSFGTYRGE